MVQEGVLLGHVISTRGIKVDKAKVKVIEAVVPSYFSQRVRSFLGHVGFYLCFIKDFSKNTKLLTHLLAKDPHLYLLMSRH